MFRICNKLHSSLREGSKFPAADAKGGSPRSGPPACPDKYLSAPFTVLFEGLEPRTLFSATIVDDALVADIEWMGEQTQALANEYVVRFNTADVKVVSLAESLWALGLDDAEVCNIGGGFGVVTTAKGSLQDLQAWAYQQADVQYLEPNFIHTMGEYTETTLPTDPSFMTLWGLNNTGQSGGTVDADIDAPEAWDLTTGSNEVVIAIIDTGINYMHPDLAANIWTNSGEIAGDGIDNDGNGFVDDVRGWDFAYNDNDPRDGNNHGTHVAGTIGARANNSRGVAGVNWNVKLMAIKFLSDGGYGSTADAIEAINYVTMMKRDYGVNVVATNNSWGGGGYSTALRDAIAASGQQDILFVAAAGNSSSNNDVSPHYPSNYNLSNVISVAATDRNDSKASFSSYGATTVDLAAPGVSIYSTVGTSGYASYSGTSMAAPHVSGVVGLLAAYNPQATAAEIKSALMDSVDVIPAMQNRCVTGGRLNAFKALQAIGTGEDVTGPTVLSVTPSGESAPVSTIAITFSEPIVASTVVGANFGLRIAGLDGLFDTGDDINVPILDGHLSQPQPNKVRITLDEALAAGSYRLTMMGLGDNPIRDEAGNPLNDGLRERRTFTILDIATEEEANDTLAQATDTQLLGLETVMIGGEVGNGAQGAQDVDVYSVVLSANTALAADVDLVGSGGSFVARLFDANGNELIFTHDDSDSASLRYVVPVSGTYYVAVSGFGNFSYDPTAGGSGADGTTGQYMLTLTTATPPASQQAGPDRFGYRGQTTAFNFEDISSFGTTGQSGYSDDASFQISAAALEGFDFEFYGDNITSLYVSTNGLITVGQSNTAYWNTDFTSSPSQATIAPLWDDMVLEDSNATVVWARRGSGDDERLIVQWDNARFYGGLGQGTVTFQAVLYEGDNSIRFNYDDLQVDNSHTEAASATVGIKDAGSQQIGEDVLRLSYNNSSSAFVGTGVSTVITAIATPPGDFNRDGHRDILWQRTTGENAVWLMDGTSHVSSAALWSVRNTSWSIAGQADFNGDGYTDILWHNATDGQNVVWAMRGTQLTGVHRLVTTTNTNWEIAAVGDLNGDGKADLVWQNSADGRARVWLMDRLKPASTAELPAETDLSWQIVGAGDFDGDGKDDILWRDREGGDSRVWLMNGATVVSTEVIAAEADQNWQVGAVGDFNGDGNVDIIWRNISTGDNRAWLMDGVTVQQTVDLQPVANTQWSMAGMRSWRPTAQEDFDGNNATDILWRKTTGDNAVWLMSNTDHVGSAALGPVTNTAWTIAGQGDFNGDGYNDILWRNTSDGRNVVWKMRRTKLIGSSALASVANTSWEVAGVGDFNGDNKVDVLWQNRDDGRVHLWMMNGTRLASATGLPRETDLSWQIAGVGDFNGDGRDDILWRDRQTGDSRVWLMSATRVGSTAVMAAEADQDWQVGAVADFTGDGKADIVWRNVVTGDNRVWMMDGTAVNQTVNLQRVLDTRWHMAGMRDWTQGAGSAGISVRSAVASFTGSDQAAPLAELGYRSAGAGDAAAAAFTQDADGRADVMLAGLASNADQQADQIDLDSVLPATRSTADSQQVSSAVSAAGRQAQPVSAYKGVALDADAEREVSPMLTDGLDRAGPADTAGGAESNAASFPSLVDDLDIDQEVDILAMVALH